MSFVFQIGVANMELAACWPGDRNQRLRSLLWLSGWAGGWAVGLFLREV